MSGITGKLVLETHKNLVAIDGTVYAYSRTMPAVDDAAVIEAVGTGTTGVVAYVDATGLAAVTGTPNAIKIIIRDSVTGASYSGTVAHIKLLIKG